jgi:acetyl esterase/lipase
MPGLVAMQSGGWGGKGGPLCPPLEEVELDCLRLTVTAPEGHKPGQKLPVMVWVHGSVLLNVINEQRSNDSWCRSLCASRKYFWSVAPLT